MTRKGEVVFTGSADWWQFVNVREGEIKTDADENDYTLLHAEAAHLAKIDTADEEAWVCQVTEVAARHSAIKINDYVCSQGIGSEVIFVRLAE